MPYILWSNVEKPIWQLMVYVVFFGNFKQKKLIKKYSVWYFKICFQSYVKITIPKPQDEVIVILNML